MKLQEQGAPPFLPSRACHFGPFQHGFLQERRQCKNRSHQLAGSKMVLSRDPARIISFGQLLSSCHRLQHLRLLLNRDCAGRKSEAAKLYTEGLKDRRNYTNFSNRRCKFSISPTRCSDRRYSCCKSSVSRGFKRFLKTDLMTVFYSSPRKNCKKPREKSIFYSLSIRGVAEVALNQ